MLLDRKRSCYIKDLLMEIANVSVVKVFVSMK